MLTRCSHAQLIFAMYFNSKGHCFGVVVICIFAIIMTFHSGVCELVGHVTIPSEQGPKNGMQSFHTAAMLKAKRQHIGPRLRLLNSSIHPKFLKSVAHLEETSRPEMSSLGPKQFQNNPTNNFKTHCKEGDVKHVVQGRFDIASHYYPSGSTHSDTEADMRGGLQPVVQCTEASMTLTVPRRHAAQLRVSTGSDFSFSLSKLPPHCGYSIHKSWRDISIVVQYNGCYVTQVGDRYVLSLLWRRTPVKISCPASPMKSQALDGLSLCCFSFGITIRIQAPSSAKQLKIKVRGDWTPLLELVQHCGYSLDHRNTEILITAPFLSCGITSRNGHRALSVQIGEEIFLLTCRTSPSEAPPTPTKPSPETPKPFQWAPPFYLVPRPRYKTRVHGNALLPHTTTSFETRQLETPQQDEQQNDDDISAANKNYHEQASLRNPAKVFPHLKHTSRRTNSPTQATRYNPSLLPHNDAFHRYYHFYHHPKIPLTNQPPHPAFVVKSKQPSEITDEAFYLYSAPTLPKLDTPMPYNSLFHHDLTRTNFGDFRNQMRSTRASPLPTFASPTPTMKPNDQGDNKKIRQSVDNGRDFKPVTPIIKLMRRPPYGSPVMPLSPISMPYHLPRDFYHLYNLNHGLQGENAPTPASYPTLQQTPNPIPASENPQNGFGSHFPHNFYQLYNLYPGPQGEKAPTPTPFAVLQQTTNSIPLSKDPKDDFLSYFHPEIMQVKPGSDPAEGLNYEGESVAHSYPSYDGNSWEQWFNMAAKVSYVPVPPYLPPPPFSVPEDNTHKDSNVKDHFSADSIAQPLASPCPGPRFHHSVSPGCFSFPVKDCIVGENFVFSLPEFVVEPRVVSPAPSEGSCAVKHLTSNPHLYLVPLHGCGVTQQVIDALTIYQLELETCDSDNSLIRMVVECSSYPGFPSVETLLILDPLPLQYSVPLQLRIATDESNSYHPEAHLPLSRLRGRRLLLEVSLLRPPDHPMALQVHYCLAYTLAPYASALPIYDGCLPGSESQLLPSLYPNTQYIVATSFPSLNSPSPSIVYDENPEVYFFCLTEVCSPSDGICSSGCINSSERK